MKSQNLRRVFPHQQFRILGAAFCTAAISLSLSPLLAQQPAAPAPAQATTTTTTEEAAPKIPNDQLDSLVAPIALYPDPLVAQVLAASTYPLEIVQLEQWMKNNATLKDKALADAVAKQSWDPSVQSLAAFPDVVKQLSEHVAWTSDMGNAFLSQQKDVMDAVQRMRAKAQGTGNLKSTAQQKVETQTVESKQVIVIEPADPEVIYVPQYSASVVYGAAPVYPYPYAYPYGYGALAFGAGIAMGAAWGGCWGDCDWHGGGDVNINNKNNFNKNNINTGNRNQGGGKWNHNPSHRGGAPYGDRGTASKYGGRARQQPAGGAGNRPGGAAGAGGFGGGQGVAGGNRPGGGAGAGAGNIGGANRPSGGAGGGNMASNRPAGGAGAGNVGGGNRAGGGGASASTRPASGGGGANSIGNRSVSSGSGFGSSNSAFGGGGGSSARSASSRGGHSMGGGGFSGGGGRGGGGGGRGGGGGGRRR